VMAQWMRAEDGSYLNLAHAVRVRRMRSRKHPGTQGEQRWVWGAELQDGTMVESNEEGWDFGEALATVVPAQPGQEAVMVSWDCDTRPTELWITRLPIVAWRVELSPDCVASPIFPDQSFEGTRRFIVLPDGKLVEPYIGEFANIEEMKISLLEAAQRDWDGAQAEKAKRSLVSDP